MLGQTLLSRYTIESEIGRGSIGTVFRAHDTLLDREVAVKVLNQKNLGPEGKARLLAEARAVAKLEHPHIMTIYDAGEVDGIPFIVLQLVQGKNLLEWGSFSYSQILSIGKQLSEALDHAHQLGIIHRDIKPENVMVSGDEGNLYARLMDFGLAFSITGVRLTKEEMLVGTAAYIAPEVILGQHATSSSDLYSLGITLYEIATGRLPYEGDSLTAVLGQHLYAPVPSVTAIKTDLPAGFDNLISRLMSKQPADRPPNAREVYGLLDQLETAKAPIPLPARKSNLPLQLTSFIGREKEIAEIEQALEQSRFVTLTGTGGTGKTRLSLQVGESMADQFKHGVWFVELAPVSDERLVPQALASSLKVMEEAGVPILDTLVKYIKDKELLLILDNCEHLTRACAEVVKQLIQSGPDLKVLATSRSLLHVAGETHYDVPSLSFPEPDEEISINSLTQYEAVRLFLDRAVSKQRSFQLTDQNARSIVDICRRLDGIPLALELAAVRVNTLPVGKIAERLNDRFRLLTSSDKTIPPRQQTLRALIDWSYDMLSEAERAVFRRLSVFEGGWTLEGAEEITAGVNVDYLDVLDLLSNLVEKSLVIYHSDRKYPRYGMLESLRQYAIDKLDESVETDLYRQHHINFFLKFAEEAEPELNKADQAIWFERLEIEHDNLRASIRWALDTSNAEIAQRLCGALGRFWWVHGYLTEGRDWLHQALKFRDGVSKPVLAKALRWAGGLAWPQGEFQAAKEAFDESISLYRQLQDMEGMAVVLGYLGTLAHNQGDYANAWEMYSQSLDILSKLGNKWGMANALNNLGNVAQEQGDYGKAQAYHQESLQIRRQLEDKRGMGIALTNLGSVAIEQNQVEMARAYFEQSLKCNYEINAKMMLAYNLSGLAQVLHGEGQYELAAQLQGVTVQILDELGALLEPFEKSLYDRTASMLKQYLGEIPYQQAFTSGKQMSIGQAIVLALKKSN